MEITLYIDEYLGKEGAFLEVDASLVEIFLNNATSNETRISDDLKRVYLAKPDHEAFFDHMRYRGIKYSVVEQDIRANRSFIRELSPLGWG